MTNEEIKYCKDCKKNNCGNILCRAKVNYVKELEKEKALYEQSIDYSNDNVDTCSSLKKRDREYYKMGLLKGYKDGLAEGKPKWHDLRKDPNDLPKESGHYWCYVDDGVFHTDYGVIYFENGKWESEKWENKTIILTWCELPKFKN